MNKWLLPILFLMAGSAFGQGSPPASPHRVAKVSNVKYALIEKTSGDTMLIWLDTLTNQTWIQAGDQSAIVFGDVVTILDLILGTGAGNAAYDATDVPTNGQQLTWGTGDVITWEAAGAITLEDVFNKMDQSSFFDTTGFNDSIGIKAGAITTTEILDQTIVLADIDSTIKVVFDSVYMGTSNHPDSVLPNKRYVDSVADDLILAGDLVVYGFVAEINKRRELDTTYAFAQNKKNWLTNIPVRAINSDSAEGVTITWNDSANALHPSVVYFPQGYLGWHYWMAFTPIPLGEGASGAQDENPHIVVSNDMENWTFVIDSTTWDSISNPIAKINDFPCNTLGNDFLSDPNLFIDNAGALWIAYRMLCDDGTTDTNAIYVQKILGTFTGGTLDFTDTVRILEELLANGSGSTSGLLSPAIFLDTGGIYQAIVVAGQYIPNRIYRYRSTTTPDSDSWTKIDSIEWTITDGNTPQYESEPWHFSVKYRGPDELTAWVTAGDSDGTALNGGLYLGISYDNGDNWQFCGRRVLDNSDNHTDFHTTRYGDSLWDFGKPTGADVGIYKSDGVWVNDGDSWYFKMIYSSLMSWRTVPQWRSALTRVTFDQKWFPREIHGEHFQIYGYRTARTDTLTLEVNILGDASYLWINSTGELTASVDTGRPLMGYYFEEDFLVESLFIVYKVDTADLGSQRLDSIAVRAPNVRGRADSIITTFNTEHISEALATIGERIYYPFKSGDQITIEILNRFGVVDKAVYLHDLWIKGYRGRYEDWYQESD